MTKDHQSPSPIIALQTALIIGRSSNLFLNLPYILHSSGFAVDLISSSREMKFSKFIRNNLFIPLTKPALPHITKCINYDYNWIIVTDENLLQEILDSPLSEQDKLKLLPVVSSKNYLHLNSKIGLSLTLHAHGIKTPRFSVASHKNEALLRAEKLGYPVLLKQDASSGGAGVIECVSPKQILAISNGFFKQRILIQEKIHGVDIDLSALFLDGKLIHFNYAEQTKTCLNTFGPSYLRTYTSLPFVEKACFQELSSIGKALGLNGFTNITCVLTANGARVYFEADARPNAWLDYSRFLGDDIATRIRAWFTTGQHLQYPVPATAKHLKQLQLPLFLRMQTYELLINRYKVWHYIPKANRTLLMRVLLRTKCAPLLNFLKKILPQKQFLGLKRLYYPKP